MLIDCVERQHHLIDRKLQSVLSFGLIRRGGGLSVYMPAQTRMEPIMDQVNIQRNMPAGGSPQRSANMISPRDTCGVDRKAPKQDNDHCSRSALRVENGRLRAGSQDASAEMVRNPAVMAT